MSSGKFDLLEEVALTVYVSLDFGACPSVQTVDVVPNREIHLGIPTRIHGARSIEVLGI